MNLKHVVVRAVDGFQFPRPIELELGPNLTLVYGPNASGKTSLTRGLQHKVWRAEKPSKGFSVEIHLRNGQVFTKDDVLPVRAIHPEKYVLRLEEIIGRTGDPIRKILSEELAGGAPIPEESVKQNGYRSALAAEQAARKELDEWVATTQAFERDYGGVSKLESNLRSAQSKLKRLKSYRLLLERADKARLLTQFETTFATFDSRLEHIEKNDLGDWEGMIQQAAVAEQNKEQQLAVIHQNAPNAAKTDFSDAEIDEVEELLSTWTKRADQASTASTALRKQQAIADEIKNRNPQLVEFQDAPTKEWISAARNAHDADQLQARLRAWATVVDKLAEVMPQVDSDLSKVAAARTELIFTTFPDKPAEKQSNVAFLWIALGCVAVAGVIRWLPIADVPATILGVLCVSVAAFTLYRYGSGAGTQVGPTQADVTQFRTQLQDLTERELTLKLKGSLERIMDIAQQNTQAVEIQLKDAPSNPIADACRAAEELIAEVRRRLYETTERLKGAEAEATHAAEQERNAREEVRQRLAEFGFSVAETLSDSAPIIKRMKRCQVASHELRRIDAELTDLQGKVRAIQNRTKCATIEELRMLNQELADYQRSKGDLILARQALDKVETEIKDKVPLDIPNREGPEETWEENISQELEFEADIEKLQAQIAKLNAQRDQIATSRQFDELSAKHAAATKKLELEKLRLIHASSKLHFARTLNHHVRTQFQPDSVRYANRLLTRLSGGRYALDVSADTFRVYDQEEGTKEFNELSSGTAIQVLLALRVGYLQASESQGYAAPLILDELLATTDPLRGPVIATALTEIAKERQVVCFTSSNQELEWFDAQEIQFVELQPLQSKQSRTRPESINPIPKPAHAETLEQYAARLGRNSIDPYGPIGMIDAGWILESTEALYTARLSGLATSVDLLESDLLTDQEKMNLIALEVGIEFWKVGRASERQSDAELRTAFAGAAEHIGILRECFGNLRKLRIELQHRNVSTRTINTCIRNLELAGYREDAPPKTPPELVDQIARNLSVDRHCDPEAARHAANRAVGALIASELLPNEDQEKVLGQANPAEEPVSDLFS